MSDLDDLLAAQQPDPTLARLAAEPLTPEAARMLPRVIREGATPPGGRHLTSRDLELIGRAVDLIRVRWGDDADCAWATLPRVVDEYRTAATAARASRQRDAQASRPVPGG